MRRSRDPRASRRGVDVHARVRPARATPSAIFDGNARGCAAADGARGDGRHVPRRGPLESRLLRLPVPLAPPPPALTALASAREPRRSLRASLHPRRLRVPDVENALRCRCELTPSERAAGCRRMRCRASNRYVADLFAIIGGDRERCEVDPVVGSRDDASRHRLSRFDLFHAHAFADAETKTVGLLFHASEYPAFDADSFPYKLGRCQTDSACAFDERKHARRNVLWVARTGNRREPSTSRSPRSARRGARDESQSAPRHPALGPRAAHDVRRGLRGRRRGPVVPARAAGQETEAPGVRVRRVTRGRRVAATGGRRLVTTRPAARCK